MILEKVEAADADPGRCAQKGVSNSLKASSTSTPEGPSICMQKRSGASGLKMNRRGLGTKKRRGLGAEEPK